MQFHSTDNKGKTEASYANWLQIICIWSLRNFITLREFTVIWTGTNCHLVFLLFLFISWPEEGKSFFVFYILATGVNESFYNTILIEEQEWNYLAHSRGVIRDFPYLSKGCLSEREDNWMTGVQTHYDIIVQHLNYYTMGIPTPSERTEFMPLMKTICVVYWPTTRLGCQNRKCTYVNNRCIRLRNNQDIITLTVDGFNECNCDAHKKKRALNYYITRWRQEVS